MERIVVVIAAGCASLLLGAACDDKKDTTADTASDTAADAPVDTAADAPVDTAMDTGDDPVEDPAGDDAAAGDPDAEDALDAADDPDTGDAMDAADMDAGDGADAEPPGIVVDGTMEADEWDGTSTAVNTVATDWGDGLNELEALHAYTDGIDLLVAIEGTIETTNAIVLFADADRGAGGGVCDLSTLADTGGDVDVPISAGFSTPADVCAELAFGAGTMDYVATTGYHDPLGWRDVTGPADDLAWIDGSDAPAACGTSMCEASIPLTLLGASSGNTIALFVRIVNDDGTAYSNQTLPEDDPSAPATVSELLELVVP
jgi:hypothetical protein